MKASAPGADHDSATSAHGLTVSVVDDPVAAWALAGEWEELADRCGAGPLVRPAHALTWWKHLGKGRLLVVVVRSAGRLVALAPLHERRVGPLRVVRWLGHGLGTVAEVLVEPGHETSTDLVWKELAGPRCVWELVECREGSEGLPVAGTVYGRGRTTTAEVRDLCPVADLGGGLAGVVHREGKKKLREKLKRCDRLLARSGSSYRTEVATDAAGLEKQLPAVRAVVDAAEAERPRLHLLRPPYEDYVLDYLRTGVATGSAIALVGYVDDIPATAQLWLRQGETLSLWIARFDPAFSDLSPGHLLYRDTYAWAESVGVTRIDLLLGDSQTKRLWTTGSYATLDVVSGHRTALALARGAERLAGVARRIRT